MRDDMTLFEISAPTPSDSWTWEFSPDCVEINHVVNTVAVRVATLSTDRADAVAQAWGRFELVWSQWWDHTARTIITPPVTYRFVAEERTVVVDGAPKLFEGVRTEGPEGLIGWTGRARLLDRRAIALRIDGDVGDFELTTSTEPPPGPQITGASPDETTSDQQRHHWLTHAAVDAVVIKTLAAADREHPPPEWLEVTCTAEDVAANRPEQD